MKMLANYFRSFLTPCGKVLTLWSFYSLAFLNPEVNSKNLWSGLQVHQNDTTKLKHIDRKFSTSWFEQFVFKSIF